MSVTYEPFQKAVPIHARMQREKRKILSGFPKAGLANLFRHLPSAFRNRFSLPIDQLHEGPRGGVINYVQTAVILFDSQQLGIG